MHEVEVLNPQEEFHSKYLQFILVIFSSLWLISTIAAIKQVSFFGITLTGGFIIFPIVAYLNYILVDVYGYKNSRQAIWYGVTVNILYLFFMHIVNLIPSSPQWTLESEFKAILIPQTRMIFASIIAFWCSGFINNYIMAKLKIKRKSLLSRIIISLFVSITFDLSIYFTIGFLGSIPLNLLKDIFIFAYIKKLIFELILLPIIWPTIDLLKKLEGFEVYDSNTKFTPFSLDNIYKITDYKKIYRFKSNYSNSIKNENSLDLL